MSTGTLRIQDSSIAYEAPNGVSGPGKTILLVHGSTFDRAIWRSVMPALAERHTPIAIDMPGHGESSGVSYRSVEEGTRLVQAVVAQLGLDRFVLIGHSLGGAIAQHFYRTERDRLIALGLLSTAPWFRASPDILVPWRADPVAYRDGELTRIVAPQASADAIAALIASRDGVSLAAQDGDMEAVVAWDARDAALEFDLPLLVMTADADLPSVRDATEAWAAANPTAVVADIPNAGHMMTVEQPEATTRAIVEWVDSLR